MSLRTRERPGPDSPDVSSLNAADDDTRTWIILPEFEWRATFDGPRTTGRRRGHHDEFRRAFRSGRA